MSWGCGVSGFPRNAALQYFRGAGMLAFRHVATAALFIACQLMLSPSGICQQGGSSPVYHVREGRNDVSLFERFSIFIEHTSRIKRVMDFDEEVVTVQTVEGTPNQFRVYALKSGVTTVTIVDENDVSYSVEILVRGDVRHLQSFIRRLYPHDSITVEEISDTAVRLDGWVSKPEQVSEIQAIAEQFYPDVLNHMKNGGVQQVLLKCTILEVQRSKLRRVGMNFSMIRPGGFLMSTPGPITPLTTLDATGAGATATFSGFSNSSVTYGFTRPNSIFQGFVQAMIEEGLLKSYATPSIVTHNGRPANFLSGGETPVPITAGLGATGIEFKEFGIQMNAVPYILGNGRIRLEVEATVRDRDFANTVTIGGTTATGFKTNMANTQVEMNFGEALVIAGLISRRENATAQKLPFFGELPWIGAAFSRKVYEESETELIILVTPEHVAPMPAGQVPSGGPGQSTDMPVDRELFAHGLLEVPKFGEDCDHCQNCMPNRRCSNYPHCIEPGGEHDQSGSCVPMRAGELSQPATGLEVAPVSKTWTRPDSGLPATETGKQSAVPRKRTGRIRSGTSGLISPTMR